MRAEGEGRHERKFRTSVAAAAPAAGPSCCVALVRHGKQSRKGIDEGFLRNTTRQRQRQRH